MDIISFGIEAQWSFKSSNKISEVELRYHAEKNIHFYKNLIRSRAAKTERPSNLHSFDAHKSEKKSAFFLVMADEE